MRELLAVAPGEALRLALLSGHYRQPLDFSQNSLFQAKSKLDRFYIALRATASVQTDTVPPPEAVEAALMDDLNTPLAIAEIDRLASRTLSHR